MRFNPYSADREGRKALQAVSAHVAAGPLDTSILRLVEVRVSQLNGCAFCLQMHADEARELGVSQGKLDTVAGWADDPLFDDRERAALRLAEDVTLIGQHGSRVSDATWDHARSAFSDEELANLLLGIGMINFWNRVNVAVEMPPARKPPA